MKRRDFWSRAAAWRFSDSGPRYIQVKNIPRRGMAVSDVESAISRARQSAILGCA